MQTMTAALTDATEVLDLLVETIAWSTAAELDEIERQCQAGMHPAPSVTLALIQRERRGRRFAAANAAICEGAKRGSTFDRCTRPARYVVADEHFGETYKNGTLVRASRAVDVWGSCAQHRDGHRASSLQGSERDAWHRLDPDAGLFNGRRLGWIELVAR